MSMKPVHKEVRALFGTALREAFPTIQQDPLVVKGNPKFGDYQCNNAMGLYKDHGKALGYANPGAVAEQIKKALPKNDVLSEVTVSPQGFVSMKLSEAWLSKQVANIA